VSKYIILLLIEKMIIGKPYKLLQTWNSRSVNQVPSNFIFLMLSNFELQASLLISSLNFKVKSLIILIQTCSLTVLCLF